MQVIAHRGARTLADFNAMAPANTMPCFQEAAKRGAAIELDISATKDGELVVYHDHETGHVFAQPGGDKFLRQSTLADLQAARLNVKGHEADVAKMLGHSDYKTPAQFLNLQIPKLSEVVLGLPQTYFYLELKTEDEWVKKNQNNQLEARIVKFIHDNNLYERVTVISFSTASLRKIKRMDSRIKTGLDFNLPAFYKRFDRLIGLFVGPFAKHFVGVDSIHSRYDETTLRMVKAAHRQNLKIMPWVPGTITRQEETRVYFPRLMAMGVDGLITNAVDLLQEAVQKNNPEREGML